MDSILLDIELITTTAPEDPDALPVEFSECSTQRLWGSVFLLFIITGVLIQLAIIYAISISAFHRSNSCYVSLLIMGIFNVLQFVAQSMLITNLFLCDNFGYVFNMIGGSINNVSYYVMEPYSFVLALTRFLTIIVRNKKVEKVAQLVHQTANSTLWLLAIFPIVVSFDESCQIRYYTYTFSRRDECVYSWFLNGIFQLAFAFMELTVFIYFALIIGLMYFRLSVTESRVRLVSKAELRILLTASSEFIGVVFVLILRTFFLDFVSLTGRGRIIYRFVLILSAFSNAALTLAFNKPLRDGLRFSVCGSLRPHSTSVRTIASQNLPAFTPIKKKTETTKSAYGKF